jgi:hypothetical protein
MRLSYYPGKREEHEAESPFDLIRCKFDLESVITPAG